MGFHLCTWENIKYVSGIECFLAEIRFSQHANVDTMLAFLQLSQRHSTQIDQLIHVSCKICAASLYIGHFDA